MHSTVFGMAAFARYRFFGLVLLLFLFSLVWDGSHQILYDFEAIPLVGHEVEDQYKRDESAQEMNL